MLSRQKNTRRYIKIIFLTVSISAYLNAMQNTNFSFDEPFELSGKLSGTLPYTALVPSFKLGELEDQQNDTPENMLIIVGETEDGIPIAIDPNHLSGYLDVQEQENHSIPQN